MVLLSRQGGEKLGMGIAVNSLGGFTITAVEEGGLLERWNAAEPLAERRIRDGDVIVSVTSQQGGGSSQRATEQGPMSDALRGGGDVTLGVVAVAASRAKSGDPPGGATSAVRRVAGTVVLEGLALRDVAEVVALGRAAGGGFEVVKVGSELAAWNAARRDAGSCCTQCIEEGDRIVSVNGATDVRAHLGVPSPTLVIIRWRPSSAFRTESFQATIERTGPEDRLGMQIRAGPCSDTDIEVLEVVASGAVARWNSTLGGSDRKRVLRGDRLLAVNGREGREAISKELSTPGTVSLRFERWLEGGENSSTVSPGVDAFAATPFSKSKPLCAVAAPPMDAAAAALPQRTPPGRSVCSGCLPMLLAVPAVGALALFGDSDLPAAGHEVAMSSGSTSLPVPEAARPFLVRIHPALYGDLGAFLFFLGAALTVRFLCYEIAVLRQPGAQGGILRQLVLAAAASLALGQGGFLLLVWAGVYVDYHPY
mmetsp:Transcript_24098/g.52595  ORF Transcript_24098/g.52595 Transcript_24098/m.52595 type:complete len:481 (+) Transcript_24098:3-1445(+)